MDKKGWIAVIFIIVIIIGSGITAYVLYEKGYFNKDTVSEEAVINQSFFVSILDTDSEEELFADYKLYQEIEIKKCLSEAVFLVYKQDKVYFYDKFKEIKGKNIDEDGCYVDHIEPKLYDKNGFVPGKNQISIQEKFNYQLYVYNEEHYVTRYDIKFKLFEENELVKINLDKIENNITFDVCGEITSNNVNDNRLVVYGDDYYQADTVCVLWDFGVISISSDNPVAETPNFDNKPDKCYKITQQELKNDILFDFNIKTRTLSEEDKITFYLFDNDIDLNELKSGVQDNNYDDLGGSNFELIYSIVNQSMEVK